MAKPILDDELWALIEPLLPPPKPRRERYSGRKPLDDRNSAGRLTVIEAEPLAVSVGIAAMKKKGEKVSVTFDKTDGKMVASQVKPM